jgi:hypothetical protein
VPDEEGVPFAPRAANGRSEESFDPTPRPTAPPAPAPASFFRDDNLFPKSSHEDAPRSYPLFAQINSDRY